MTDRRVLFHRVALAVAAGLCVALWFDGVAFAGGQPACARRTETAVMPSVDTHPSDDPTGGTAIEPAPATACHPDATSAPTKPTTASTVSTDPALTVPELDDEIVLAAPTRLTFSFSALAAPAPAPSTDTVYAVAGEVSTPVGPSSYDTDVPAQDEQPFTVEVSDSGSGTTTPPPPATDVPPSGGTGPDELALTGPGMTIWLTLTGLVLLDLGWLMVSACQAPRKGQVASA